MENTEDDEIPWASYNYKDTWNNADKDSNSVLSGSALDALKEFYAERDERQKKFEKLKQQAEDRADGVLLSMDAFAEDWNESQFWVSSLGFDYFDRYTFEDCGNCGMKMWWKCGNSWNLVFEWDSDDPRARTLKRCGRWNGCCCRVGSQCFHTVEEFTCKSDFGRLGVAGNVANTI